MQTNKQLKLATDFVKYTGHNIFLTGKAGTGKTTFLKTLRENSPKRMVVVAPTGVAAINAGGVTIHSFFQLSFAPQVGTESQLAAEQRFNKEKINIIRTLDLIIIDEISMVRADVLDAIDRTMRRFKNRKKPFGGAQLLMIGDLQQLAPIVKNEEWNFLKREYKTPYFFSSKVLMQFPYVSIELTEVFRQQDQKFISLLNKVRDNLLDEKLLDELNKRHSPNFVPDDEEGYITLCTHNISAQRINDDKLRALKTTKKTFSASVDGKFPEYAYPTLINLELKVGAQVMFVKNDSLPEKRFFNGKIGQITNIAYNTVFVQCPGDTDEIEVEPQTWENYKYSLDKISGEIKEEVEGTFTQMPLKLAWAITIHKSQGLTFEKAIIDAEASFAHGQVYVALSRCKTLNGLVLSTPILNRSIINDETLTGFIKEVEQNQPGEVEFSKAKIAFQKEQLIELFSFYRVEYLLRSLTKVINQNKGSFPEITITQLARLKDRVETEIFEIASKFTKKIDEYLQLEPEIEKNKKLGERVKKAAAYFTEKTEEILIDDFNKIDFEIDNREVKRQLKRFINDLNDESNLKLSGFEQTVTGFDVNKIMNARAKAMVSSVKSSKKIKAKEISNFQNIPHHELFEKLRDYRNEQASEREVPHYMIFSQRVLYELATYLPTDSVSLKLINGLGARKIEQFGADILHIIQHYCNENNIEKTAIPLQNPKKEKKPKIDTKKVSFELFKSGKTVDEIAKERALSNSTIEGHLAHFVKIGELNVLQLIDEKKLKKILSYFESSEDKSFSTAKNHFGNEVTYGELRIALSYMESGDAK